MTPPPSLRCFIREFRKQNVAAFCVEGRSFQKAATCARFDPSHQPTTTSNYTMSDCESDQSEVSALHVRSPSWCKQP